MTRCHSPAPIGLAFLTVALVFGGCAEPNQRLYERSIRDAAVRGSDWATPLWPLPDGPVSVSTFTDDQILDVKPLYVWVAATQEVWARCHGRRDPVLALEQLLGLPPLKAAKSGHPWHFFIFDVPSHDLRRPCPGGVDAGAPGGPTCRLISDVDPALDPQFTQFLLQQWWLAHRATIEADRDPELGYPWTGMGWTYDWDPTSKNHRGVSEFVVAKTAAVSHVQSLSPQEFCDASAAPLR